MKKRLMGILTMLVLAMGMMPAGVFAAITGASTASITVNNAVPGDKLSAYKIIDISYDAGTNNVSHAFNSDFAEYFEEKGIAIDDFAALESDSDALKNALADLPEYIADKSVSSVAKKNAGDEGIITFSGLSMGEYFILPVTTTSVYQLMLQKVEPTVESGSYVLNNVAFAAKHKEVDVTKTADKTSVTKNEKVNYTVTVDVPAYQLTASSKSFSIRDTLDTGLRLDQDSIKVEFEGGSTVPEGMYSIENLTEEGFTLKVDNNHYDSEWLAKAGSKLTVKYSAVFDDSNKTDNVVNAFGNKVKNNVEFTYSVYPFSGATAVKTASADVNSYIIQVSKYDKNDSSKKLSGAKFELYRSLSNGETGTEIPHTSVEGKLLETLTTDSNGLAQFRKYEANGEKYDYYLVETAAPSGYNILSNAVKVNFSDTQVDQTTGIYTVDVPNSTGFQLPVTGDKGTFIMTLIGIVIMAGAVALLAVTRRRKNA